MYSMNCAKLYKATLHKAKQVETDRLILGYATIRWDGGTIPLHFQFGFTEG